MKDVVAKLNALLHRLHMETKVDGATRFAANELAIAVAELDGAALPCGEPAIHATVVDAEPGWVMFRGQPIAADEARGLGVALIRAADDAQA